MCFTLALALRGSWLDHRECDTADDADNIADVVLVEMC